MAVLLLAGLLASRTEKLAEKVWTVELLAGCSLHRDLCGGGRATARPTAMADRRREEKRLEVSDMFRENFGANSVGNAPGIPNRD